MGIDGEIMAGRSAWAVCVLAAIAWVVCAEASDRWSQIAVDLTELGEASIISPAPTPTPTQATKAVFHESRTAIGASVLQLHANLEGQRTARGRSSQPVARDQGE